MKMFNWSNCEFNAQYSGGDIIVMAETVEDARKVALKEAKKYIDDYCEYNMERHNEKMEAFKKDIVREPSVQSVLFIGGSA